ncbi:hypothetical protein GCM10011588_67230 [Nocardia jinanensis]|uniref:Uncharacterized protein n=1 Tax=Nocardia jinanensis TaxID=382504 RepID=A0A917RYH9_9NOCA|nr:hypothetical protein GCM10011588_67230 [Nocardia jinanensis]
MLDRELNGGTVHHGPEPAAPGDQALFREHLHGGTDRRPGGIQIFDERVFVELCAFGQYPALDRGAQQLAHDTGGARVIDLSTVRAPSRRGTGANSTVRDVPLRDPVRESRPLVVPFRPETAGR